MNSQQQIITTGSIASGYFAIAYLLGDESYDAIEFGNIITTGTLSSDFIVVASAPSSQYNLDFYGPVTLTFNPSALNFSNKINRITYSTSYATNYLYENNIIAQTNSFYYSPTSTETANLPYASEPGDPRNFTYTQDFLSNNYFTNVYVVTISIYQTNVVDPFVIFYQVTIHAPNIDDVSVDVNGDTLSPYFQEAHLISTRMFGTNDDILYTFEALNPNYTFPVLVNWTSNQVVPVNNTNIPPTYNTPYRLLQPYEIENLNSNGNIKVITQVQSNNVNDNGTPKTFIALNAG